MRTGQEGRRPAVSGRVVSAIFPSGLPGSQVTRFSTDGNQNRGQVASVPSHDRISSYHRRFPNLTQPQRHPTSKCFSRFFSRFWSGGMCKMQHQQQRYGSYRSNPDRTRTRLTASFDRQLLAPSSHIPLMPARFLHRQGHWTLPRACLPFLYQGSFALRLR